MIAPVAVQAGGCRGCRPLPPDSTVCPNCRQRPRPPRHNPMVPQWPTCAPCFFRPDKWRVPCTCGPVLAETTATHRINQRHNDEPIPSPGRRTTQ